ncbi:MAG: hypothetical protein AAF805_02060 [Planctomycetota bacterium]
MTARPTPDDDQLPLPLSLADAAFAERMSALRAALDAVDPAELLGDDGEPLGLTPKRWANAREVVMAVWSYSGADPHGACYVESQRVADTAADGQAWGKTTYYDARADAEAAGLLDVTLRHRRPARLAVRVGDVQQLAELCRAKRSAGRLPGRYGAAAGRSGTGRNQAESSGAGRNRPDTYRNPPNPLTLRSPSPPSEPGASGGYGNGRRSDDECHSVRSSVAANAAARTAADAPGSGGREGFDSDWDSDSGEWAAAVAAVAACGVAAAESAVAVARVAGATPGDVAAVVAAWRSAQTPAPPAWGPGALKLRLERWADGQAPADAFPPADPAHAAAVDRARRDAERAGQARRHVQRRRERSIADGRRASEADRRARLAAIAESIDDATLSAWLDDAAQSPFERTVYRDPRSPLALEAIADRLEAARLPEPAGAAP